MAYSRVYHSIIDDARFLDVYADDGALAAWLRLLIAADAMYPAPAPLPRTMRTKALGILVSAGLVELVGPSHYRIHGLAAERDKRSESARNAAASRWHRNGNANPMLDEQSKAETRRDGSTQSLTLRTAHAPSAAGEPR